MLRGETHTGVTLQTLHPTKFDEGVVLDQTPEPGVLIPNPASYTYADLQRMSAAMAAEILINAIREKSFVVPYHDIRKVGGKSSVRAASFAPKIEPRTRCLDFQIMSSSQIMRMNRAIAPLWTEARLTSDSSTSTIIFGSSMHLAVEADSAGQDIRIISSIEPGLPYMSSDEEHGFKINSAPLLINTVDGQTLIVPTLKMPGTPFRPAAVLAQIAGLFTEPSQEHGQRVRTFRKPLKAPEDIRQYLGTLWHPAERIT